MNSGLTGNPTLFAVVDIGSNSFRMEVARFRGEELERVAYFKEPVRLAMGLDDAHHLSGAAVKRGLEALRTFRQELDRLGCEDVQAVATNTLRVATNPNEFLEPAAEALGHPIHIISGETEARLIFSGVTHSLPPSRRLRLVFDIGGGSTEFILGRGFDAMELASLQLGAVTFTSRYFRDGRLEKETLKAAIAESRRIASDIYARFSKERWEVAYGASGTIGAVSDILLQEHWTDGRITADGLTRLRKALQEAGHADRLKLRGLRAHRVPVIAGGLTVLAGIFEAFELEALFPSKGALRHGLLHAMHNGAVELA